jgi:phenylpyruvate tautomerase PptA (4-oxalocrotonate tautomerase family)
MPMISVKTSAEMDDPTREQLLAALSRLIVEGIGKPETYVMGVLETASLIMSGEEGNAAFVEIRSIGGLSGEVNRSLSEKVCSLLELHLQVPRDRVYINFFDLSRENWGWNSKTFG